MKKLKDPLNYNLQEWLRIADPSLRAPLRVTEMEVNACLAL